MRWMVKGMMTYDVTKQIPAGARVVVRITDGH